MNNDPRNRTTHARRRPEAVVNDNSGELRGRPSVDQASRSRQVSRSGQHHDQRKTTQRRPDSEYKFSAGNSRRPTPGATASRHVTTLTPADERRLARRENRAIREYRREEEWQKEVVRVRGGIDVFMLAIILIMLALGSITVFSASYPRAISEDVSSSYYIANQAKFLVIGFVVMIIAIIIPIKWYKNWAPIPAYVVSAILLVAVLFIGRSVGEAVRWIKIGPFNLQPSELMKISLVLMIAWYAEKYEKQMKDLDRGKTSYKWNILYPCIILGIACVLVLIGRHLSGTIIVGCIGFFMLILAGCKLSWLLFTVLPVAAVALGGFLALNPYALKRITTFTDDNADVLDELYQTTQSIYAIGSGGLFGKGFGQSQQKYGYLGNAHTDFIFSVWCEELGFIGAVALILLFLLFIWRGYVIALRSPDKFTMLTAFGITTHVGIQAFLNMCVASDIIMNTGVTLPFFSYGGSALIVLMGEMGILLSISRQYYRKKSDIEREELLKKAGMD